MKIYFEDGQLMPVNFDIDFIVDAKFGFSYCFNELENIKNNNPNARVYTNFIGAFTSRFAWNSKLKVPEIFIRAGEKDAFCRIDSLTTRYLREGHNFAKMWISGEFS